MPLPLTHALVPLVAAVAIARRPVPRRLIAAAAIAAMIPDVDALSHHFLGVARDSLLSHRGIMHSLGAALVAGLIAAGFHERLRVRRWVAGVVVGAAMASHGLLDMMTDSGKAVAYFWPLSPARYVAIWRPIHIVIEDREQLLVLDNLRQLSEIRQVLLPMLLVAIFIRIVTGPTRAGERR